MSEGGSMEQPAGRAERTPEEQASGTQWFNDHGGLMLLERIPDPAERAASAGAGAVAVPAGEPAGGSGSVKPDGGRSGWFGMPRYLVVISAVLLAFGLVMMVMAGGMMAEGDFSSTGSSRRARWVTPPIAFALGALLALSPLAIYWQEKYYFGRGGRTRRGAAREYWETSLAMHPEQGIQAFEGDGGIIATWTQMTEVTLREVTPAGREVVRHYLEHPEDRHELAGPAGVERARQLGGRGRGVA